MRRFPGAHLAGAILVDPAGSVPVPEPVVGAGLPGLTAACSGASAENGARTANESWTNIRTTVGRMIRLSCLRARSC